ncbi:hypothetical protein [Paenibacillus silvae]|uniref:hypothetical protein n=1 Tax=Paenibacillus silvae TaxID=1325358 RepID=UPI002002A237|nr:hypothetical protein [Paenibacillus silvae]MCK6150644.1 hypothetical protein [Paenibacillus silvae]
MRHDRSSFVVIATLHRCPFGTPVCLVLGSDIAITLTGVQMRSNASVYAQTPYPMSGSGMGRGQPPCLLFVFSLFTAGQAWTMV